MSVVDKYACLTVSYLRLEELMIADCPNLISIPSIGGSSSLLSLRLDGCKGLKSLPSGLPTCTSLQYLGISNCTNLKAIPEDVGQLRSLQDLYIKRCQNLKRFPEEHLGCLTRLKTLELDPFSEELEEFPGVNSIHHLYSSLEDLTLFGWKRLSSLPDQLQGSYWKLCHCLWKTSPFFEFWEFWIVRI